MAIGRQPFYLLFVTDDYERPTNQCWLWMIGQLKIAYTI